MLTTPDAKTSLLTNVMAANYHARLCQCKLGGFGMRETFDVDYYSRRATQERDLAARSADPVAASLHEELAELYEDALKSKALPSERMPTTR